MNALDSKYAVGLFAATGTRCARRCVRIAFFFKEEWRIYIQLTFHIFGNLANVCASTHSSPAHDDVSLPLHSAQRVSIICSIDFTTTLFVITESSSVPLSIVASMSSSIAQHSGSSDLGPFHDRRG